MAEFSIPYGKGCLTLTLPDSLAVEVIAPAEGRAAPNPTRLVQDALDSPVSGVRLEAFAGARSAALAINDKTRPVPHDVLLPPLLERLESLGLPPQSITLIIAVGAHPPMPREAFGCVLPVAVLARYPVVCHDADDRAALVYLGETERGTPVWINRRLAEADLRVVVGNIEPHQFMGFSGGVKSAAIGLAGRETINHNHAMMTHPCARLGRYDDNPPRQDVEAIGRMAGVQFALNAILDRHKQIVAVLAGEPGAVMREGIPLARALCQVSVPTRFDLVVASPGGHPKDLNLYQAQKALAHAAAITKPGGWIILVAACPEGTGSRRYERWLLDADPPMTSHQAVIARFQREGFRVGPHKAYQIARDAIHARLVLLSEMPPDLVKRLLLTPARSLDEAVAAALAALPPDARVGVMPQANATAPALTISEAAAH